MSRRMPNWVYQAFGLVFIWAGLELTQVHGTRELIGAVLFCLAGALVGDDK